MDLTRASRALLALAGLVACAAAQAAGDGGGGGTSVAAEDPDYTEAVAAIRAEKFPRAIELLERHVKRQPGNADAENWLGYAYRRSGQLDAAFVHYDKALAIHPTHLGAHEYVGEAWLLAGRLDKAEEHLKVLDRLCFLPCEQYSDLKRAVADYKAGKRPVAATR